MGKAIGIDFGTTNTVVTYQNRKGKFKQLSYNGSSLIPSAIFFNSEKNYIIGQIARTKLRDNPQAGATSFKALLQTGEPCDLVAGNGATIKQSAARITTFFLSRIFEDIQAQLFKEFGNDGQIESLLITVPTGFSDTAKSAIHKAAAKASRLDEKMVKREYEPTAAAIAAMHEDGEDAPDSLLVYDFGGGTFDVSFIKKENGVYREIARGGDEKLGGNTLTRKVMADLLKMANREYGTDFPLEQDEFDEDVHGITSTEYQMNMLALEEAANNAKEELSELQETDISFNFYIEKGQSEPVVRSYERSRLERLIGQEVLKTLDITAQVLKQAADKDAGPVGKLVLAGGSSRIPMIRDMLEKRFPQIPVSMSEEASTIISCGAAILAQKLGELDHMTSHITSHRLGVSAAEGMLFNKFQTIIAENQPLPCEGSRDFILAFDGQRRLDIHYYQHDVGKNPNASSIQDDSIQQVDELRIDLPEGLKKSETVVAVRFLAQKDGSLDISAQIKDQQGNVVGGKELTVNRQSEVGW